MLKYIAKIKLQMFRLIKQIDDFAGGWLGLLARATADTLKPEAEIIAAAIAYFALFSLFPITLLSIAIASFHLGQSMNQQFIIRRLEFIAPNLSQLLGSNIDEIIKARGPVTGIALIGLVWSASTVFYTFMHTLNEIWGMKQRRAVWRRRGVAILFVLIFVGPALFIASFVGSMVSYLSAFLPASILALGGGFSLALAFVLDIALFMSLYMMLPHGAATWREIFPGALAAGLLWEIAKKAFLAFISAYISASNLVYGSVAAIIAFLFWAYLSGLIFLFGAHLSVAYFDFKLEQKEKADEIDS